MDSSKGAPVLRILIVEDSADDADLMTRELGREGLDCTVGVVETEPAFVEALAAGPDVILCDPSLPQFSAQRALEIMRERASRIPILVVSGTITDELAVQYMQQGAWDYVLKDRLRRLGPAVRNALERRTLEGDAAQANQRLSQLLTDLDIAQISTDLYGNILECNDVAWRMLGFDSKASAIAQRMTANYVEPRERSDLLALLAEKSAVQDCAVRLRRQDGAIIWASGHYHATKDEHGRIAVIQALLVDSTERKLEQLELSASRQRLDSALRNAPIALATLDRHLQFTFAGGTALSRVRTNPDRLLGKSARELLSQRPDVIRMLEQAAAGQAMTEEMEFGSRYFQVNVSPISDAETGGVAVVAMDITSRHAAEVKADVRARQQLAVRSLAQEGLSSPPAASLVQRAVALLVEALGAESGTVFEVQQGGRIARRTDAKSSTQPADVMSLGGGIPMWLVTHSEARAIDEILPEDQVDMPWLAQERLVSVLCAPIRDEHRVYGILAAGHRSTHHWSDDEREFIEVMAQTLWVAIEHRRLEEERSDLVRRLVDAHEEERRRIAADVHDDAVQVMSAAMMRLHLLGQKLTDTKERELITKLQSTVSLSIERLRSLLFELSPPALEQQGLQVALGVLADETQRDHGIVVQIAGGLTSEPDAAAGLSIYRIVQEALTNVQKHAQAKHVKLTLHDVDRGVQVLVEDDGVGFDPSNARSGGLRHVGLGSMRERAQLAGGTWRVRSAPGAGTQVEFWVPTTHNDRERYAS